MKRIATALVGIPLAILITLFSPDWLFTFVIAALGAVCFDELLGLAAARLGRRPSRGVVLMGALVTAAFMWGPPWVLAAVVAALLTSMIAIMAQGPSETTLAQTGIAALGILYCSTLIGFIVLLQRELVLLLFAIIWAGDSAAYYVGKSLGRRALAPTISPKKTVEGSIAGLLGSVAAGVIVGAIFLGETPGKLMAASVVTAVAGQIGDLAESALKRSAGVKDSSALLPGHGGLLDRLDSILFAAPMFYWFFHA